MISERSRDVVRRGEEIYQTKLRTTLEASHPDLFLAIEPDSGEYFFGETFSEAIQAARKAHPDRISYTLRIGHPAALHLGALMT
jgi:hypothetical protein